MLWSSRVIWNTIYICDEKMFKRKPSPCQTLHLYVPEICKLRWKVLKHFEMSYENHLKHLANNPAFEYICTDVIDYSFKFLKHTFLFMLKLRLIWTQLHIISSKKVTYSYHESIKITKEPWWPMRWCIRLQSSETWLWSGLWCNVDDQSFQQCSRMKSLHYIHDMKHNTR